MYKYAIKHFNSVFFSLYCIFDIVQYSVDAVYIAGALFEDRLGLNAGQVCPQTLYFKGLSCPRQEQLGESGTWRGNFRAVRGGRTEVCSDCVPQGVPFHLWLISEVAYHCGELQRQLPGPLTVSVAAAGKVLKEGNS